MDDALAADLRQAVGELVRAVRTVDTMPPGHAAILGYLDRSGPLTTTDLAQRRKVTHQSAAKSVKELLALGLISAHPHPEDRRKLLLHLADAGRTRLHAERSQRADSLEAAIRDSLDPDEQQHLRTCVELLTRLTRRLSEG
ncbi:MarR family winged helix-turn-helix transcriptional regulator [Nocardia sp. NPDC088792]|uniref:MarR family winged helix-turn-helix transcriptional regulator n=1 Tax=Nocardia sp. NPDC088792 TaxID=3364332 RepID=UPI00381016C5